MSLEYVMNDSLYGLVPHPDRVLDCRTDASPSTEGTWNLYTASMEILNLEMKQGLISLIILRKR